MVTVGSNRVLDYRTVVGGSRWRTGVHLTTGTGIGFARNPDDTLGDRPSHNERTIGEHNDNRL
jgi:hypothetical protein